MKNKVYIIIKRTSEDYHGSSDEIMDIFDSHEKAETEMTKIAESDYKSNTEYYIDTYNVK